MMLNEQKPIGETDTPENSGDALLQTEPVINSAESENPARYNHRYFNTLVGAKRNDNGFVCMPAPADRLMPSPFAADIHLRSFCPDGFYNYIADDPPGRGRNVREQLDRLSVGTERATSSAFQHWLQERHGMEFAPDKIPASSVVVCESASDTIQSLLDAYDPSGNAIVGVITPTYPRFLHMRCGSLFTTPMIENDEGWKFDVSKFEDMIRQMDAQKGDVKALLLSHPNNPNGYVFSPTELQQIVTICKRHGVKIISDEVWSDQVQNKQSHVPLITIAQREGYAKSAAMVYGTGKAFNTSAFPCSVAIVPDEKTRTSLKLQKPSNEAAITAIDCMKENGGQYMDALNTVLNQNAKYACDALKRVGLQAHVPDATSVICVRLAESKNDVLRMQSLFEQAGIEMNAYDVNGNWIHGMPGYARINIAVPFDELRKNFDELEKVWSKS
ncbi:aminotransferase class I/II-fold pyridoxal phosphate-dependent enzyme [Candidatus Peribacteria bacterium]|nr:aminotransferase class I/II-fold pyridoxal phosphate-dependent enzyme [Candidatus Peribacteria bacterium]